MPDTPKQNLVAQVAGMVPANLAAKASPALKDYLMNMVANVASRRETILKTQKEARKREVLAAYVKSVRLDKLNSAVEKAKQHLAAEQARAAQIIDRAKDKLKEAQTEVMRQGVTPEGAMIDLHTYSPRQTRWMSEYGPEPQNGGYYVYDATGQPMAVSQEVIDRILQTKALLSAVEEESKPIVTPTEALNLRMMMAQTTAECLAIVNGIAGEDIFGMNEQIRATLEDLQQPKGKRPAATLPALPARGETSS